MRNREKSGGDTVHPVSDPAIETPPSVPKRRRIWRAVGIVLLVLILVLGIARAFLPWAVRDYVNRTIDRNPLYQGSIGKVNIHLWRGAYSIEEVRLSKTSGNVPVPFFAAHRVDFALEWNALLKRKVVGRVKMEQPEINFVDAPTDGESQSGSGGPWLLMIKDLFPFKINSAVIKNGSIHFRAYNKARPVDVFISQVEAAVDNLGNIRDETNPLVATVQATGLVMDQAKFEYKMALDPFSYRPTFHVAVRLLGLDVTKINDLALAYGKFDFKRGWFDLVLETDSKEGQIVGYAKPLFRNLKVFSLTEDLKEDNVLQFFWQALVGGATSLFKNHSRDQFGTLIPFTGDASAGTTTDFFATLGNILRNAFVRAYLPRLEAGQESVGGITFQASKISDPISPTDSP
ncbi:MAG: DUF748 domain-containing protein [Verrucomicrobiota bacterium]